MMKHPSEDNIRIHIVSCSSVASTSNTFHEVRRKRDNKKEAEAVILRGPHEDLKSFLEAVDQLKGVIHFFSSNKNFKSCEGVLNQVNNLLTKSKLKIEEEFRQLMGTYRQNLHVLCGRVIHFFSSNKNFNASASEPSSLLILIIAKLVSPHIYLIAFQSCHWHQKGTLKQLESNYLPPRILPLLHDIAHQLVRDGNQQSCYRIYRDARSSALELSLQKLGIEKLTEDKMQQWVASNMKVGTWTHIMQITVKVLLSGERKFCDQIFDGITFNKDQCFAEVAGSSVMTLLGFGDVVSKSKRSHENLFLLLEMYGLMHGLQSEVEVTFQGKFCSGMREAALNLTKSLAQAAQETLVDFEVAVEKDNSKTIVQNRNLHPFTIKMINYVKGLFELCRPFRIT